MRARGTGARSCSPKLHDTPGALWTRATIEAASVAKPPKGKAHRGGDRPAGKLHRTRRRIRNHRRGADGDGDPAADGPVVAGDTPSAGQAGDAGDRNYLADPIVAEVNNGGDMVETVIRPDRRQRAREIRARQPREVFARRTGGGFVSAGPRETCRRVRQAGGPDVPDDAGIRPPRGGVFTR